MEAQITVPFVYWNRLASLQHKITALAVSSNLLVTGSKTGDLCIWSEEMTAQIISTVNSEQECTSLALIYPPYHRLIGSSRWIVSLHEDSILRAWDSKDGRCMKMSSSSIIPEDLFSLENINGRLIAVSGRSSEIVVVDTWFMTGVGSFCMRAPLVNIIVTKSPQRVFAIDTSGYFSVWEDFIVKTDFNQKELKIHNIPTADGTFLHFQPTGLEVADNSVLIAVFSSHHLQVLHKKDFKLGNTGVYLDLKGPIIACKFSPHALYVLHDTDKLSFVQLAPFQEKMSSDVCYVETSVFFTHTLTEPFHQFRFYRDVLYMTHESNVCVTKLNNPEIYTQKYKFLNRKAPPDSFADYNMQHLIKTNESITTTGLAIVNEELYYLLGTSTGNVIVSPASPSLLAHTYSFHISSITCIFLSESKLISCSSDNTVCVWAFAPSVNEKVCREPQDKRRVVRLPTVPRATRKLTEDTERGSVPSRTLSTPTKVISLWASPITKLISVSCLQDTVQKVDREYWKNSWKDWEQTNLGQCEDGSLVLLSLLKNAVVCYFQAIPSLIQTAQVHVMFEYLLVSSSDGKIFIFNMMIQALERIVSEETANSMIRKPLVAEFPKTDPFLTMMEQRFNNKITEMTKTDHIQIGGGKFPLLMINITEIAKLHYFNKDIPGYVKYILSLCTCSIPGCHAFLHLKELVSPLFELEKSQIHAYTGVYSLGHFSFILPGKWGNYQISPYISGSLLMSELNLLEAVLSNKEQVTGVKRQIFAHAAAPTHNVRNFHYADPVFVAIQALSGSYAARKCLQCIFMYMNINEKQRMFDEMRTILDHTVSKDLNLVAALASTLLGYLSLEDIHIYSSFKHLFAFLKKMTVSDSKGYVTAAIEIISRNIFAWKNSISETSIQEFIRILLIYACAQPPDISEFSFKALARVSKQIPGVFLTVIANELPLHSVNKHYPGTCISALSRFISKSVDLSQQYLQQLVEVILRSLDPHDSVLRKLSVFRAAECLQLLVSKLPSIDFHQHRQRLGLSNQDNLVIIYDLKVASRWKTFRGHEGPVTAVAFNREGTAIFSFSHQDLTIRMWRLDVGFLSGLLKNTVSETSVKVPNLQSSHLDNKLIRIQVVGDNTVVLTREDGNRYTYEMY